MAFSRSRILRVVMKYSQEVDNPYMLDPKKMVYDPTKYGYRYSNKLIAEGFEKGQRFLSRIPQYREIHPEIMDQIKAQRLILLYSIFGVILFVKLCVLDTNHQERDLHYQLFKDKEFVDRYSYKQLEVEYTPRIYPPYPV